LSEAAPVQEVVLSIHFASQDQLVAPRIPEMLGEWYGRHPKITTVPRYDMPSEAPSLYAAEAGHVAARLEVVVPGTESRYWFSSSDDVFVIQLQKDYLALNWRRGAAPYASYASLRERFVAIAETLQGNLSAQGGALSPVRAELTYVNIMGPNHVWRRPSDLHRILELSFWDDGSYEQMALQYSKPLLKGSEWIGRTHVTVQPMYDWLKEEPGLSINLTARSGVLEKDEFSEALDFLDYAHGSLNASFRSMFRADALSIWGPER
jgi:uncharacterized protein (TIGR04255 family)